MVAGPASRTPCATTSAHAADAGRAGSRTSLLAFAQLTDVHIIDAQSPARVEYVDRFEDKYSAERPDRSAC